MRIAQVAPLWTTIPPTNYGGIELLLALLCDELVERGHDVTLFASGDCRTKARLHPVLPTNLNDLMGEGKAYFHEYYITAVMAETLARQDEFDVLHFHLPMSLLPLTRLARKPCIFTLHSSPHVDDLWAMEQYPNATIVGISRSQCGVVQEQLRRELPVIFNGIDFRSYHPCFESGKYLAFLGRMSRQKNPVDAIRVAQAAGMPIVLAGRPQADDEKEYFEKNVEPLIDGENVRWVGAVNHPEKVELLRHAAALVFPIQWDEPFGLVMIEAMACGTPVLALNRGSVTEILEDGVTGYNTQSVEEIVEKIPAALKLNRENVRAAAENRFSYRQMVEDYEALYAKVSGSR